MEKEKRSALIRLFPLDGDPGTGSKPDQRPERSGESDKLYLERQGEHIDSELDGNPYHEICDKDRQVDIAKIAFRPINAASGERKVTPLPEEKQGIERDT